MTSVAIPMNPNVFRRNPKLGIGLGLTLLGIAAAGFLVEYNEYRSLGNDPQALTIEQAVPSPAAIPDNARWVRFTESLVPDCNLALQETSNGQTTGIRVLASDGSKQRWFYVRLQGNVNCDVANQPLTGILKKADPSLPAWLKDKGVIVPASTYPLMELSVGEDPGSVKLLLGVFTGMGVLGLVIVVVFANLLKQSTARRPMAKSATIGR